MAVIHIVDDGTAGIGELAAGLRQAGHVVVVAPEDSQGLAALGESLRSELERVAVTDPLTGLANRRRLIDAGEGELLRAQRAQSLLCVLMLDIDHFRRINDTHGHDAGDAVIKAVAQACAQTVRALDTLARLDGGRFAIVAPMTDCKGAVELGERLRERVEATAVERGGTGLRATLSVGVAQGTPKSRNFDTLLIAAEQALRRAKRAGRNRVAATIYAAPEERPGT